MSELSLSGPDLRTIISEVLSEQRRQQIANADEETLRTIATILTSFGIEEQDRIELRADFIHLRKWRKSVESAQGLSFKVIVTALVTGFVGALWLGFKTIMGK